MIKWGSKITVKGDIADIELSSGLIAAVDAVDAQSVAQLNWHSVVTRGHIYVQSYNRGSMLSLHRFIMRAIGNSVVDHIDGNGLDNRRSNLRLCTKQQNAWNSRLSKNNKSGFKGVSLICGRYAARGYIGKQVFLLGTHDTAEQAAAAYDAFAREKYGEYACLNFAKDGEQSVFHNINGSAAK